MTELNKFQAYRADFVPGCSCGFSFDASAVEEINTFVGALNGISGVSDVSASRPNSFGIVSVWYTPQTATAYAITHALTDAFKALAI